MYCNEIWASDITYIKLGDRMVYFHFYNRPEEQEDPLVEAFREDGYRLLSECASGGIGKVWSAFHIQHGCLHQYTSDEFTGMLESHGIQFSMDGIGR